jgi:hypothetical protein
MLLACKRDPGLGLIEVKEVMTICTTEFLVIRHISVQSLKHTRMLTF